MDAKEKEEYVERTIKKICEKIKSEAELSFYCSINKLGGINKVDQDSLREARLELVKAIEFLDKLIK